MKKIMSLFIPILTLFILCACFPKSDSVDVLSQIEFETSEYNIDEVTFKFYFGPNQKLIDYSRDENHMYTYGPVYLFFSKSYISVSVPVDFENPNIYLIREIAKEDFFSDAYLQDNFRGRNAVYNHYEMITIPKELFDEESGNLKFYLWVDMIRKETGTYMGYAGAWGIEYRIEGNKVLINPKE